MDPTLFGSIIRTYISVTGVQFVEDQPCVFDGLQNVLDSCVAWYEEHLSLEKAGQLVREEQLKEHSASSLSTAEAGPSTRREEESSLQVSEPVDMPPGITLHVGEAIHDRKSTFVGRACQISHPSQVRDIVQAIQILAHKI